MPFLSFAGDRLVICAFASYDHIRTMSLQLVTLNGCPIFILRSMKVSKWISVLYSSKKNHKISNNE